MKSFIQSPLLALLLAGICHADAQTTQSIAVNNWFAINNKSGNTAYVQDGTTSSPIFKQVDGDASLFVFSYFDSQATLNDGESLSLTFDLTLALSEEGGTKTFDLVSYGLYKSVDLKASPSYSNIGADRTATTSQLSPFINGWGGFLIHKPSAQSHHHLRAYQKTPGASYNFASVSGTEPTYYSIPNTGSYKLDFTDGVARTFTLTYNRVGNDLHISGQLKDGQSFNTVYKDAFLQEGSNLFDAFGFYIAQGSANGPVIVEAAFSNLELIHVIPEPGSTALLLGAGGLLWIRRRSRMSPKH